MLPHYLKFYIVYFQSVTTGYCNSVSPYTLAKIPGRDDFSNVTATSFQVNWTDNGNPAGTEYFCENITAGQNVGRTTNTYWVCGGLTPETVYNFRVKARNFNNVETSWCALGTNMMAFIDNDGNGLPDSWKQQIIDADRGDGIETI